MKHVALWTLLGLALAGAAWAQDLPDKSPAEDRPVPAPAATAVREPEGDLPVESAVSVGAPAPEFSLDGSQGRPVKLADLKGHWAVLVFELERKRFADLQGITGDLGELGVSLYGVCPDGVGKLEEMAASAKLSFPVLSDPSGEVSQLYGMVDAEAETSMPGIVLLNPRGVVRGLWTGPSLRAAVVLQLVQHTVPGSTTQR